MGVLFQEQVPSVQLQTLPKVALQPPFDEPRLTISIRGEQRIPRLTDAVALPERIFRQAEIIGTEILKASQQLPSFLKDQNNRDRIGLSPEIYNAQIEPFLNLDQNYLFLGVDTVIDRNGNVKVIELNPRPQALGIYDEVFSRFLDANDPNAKISPSLKLLIDKVTQNGKTVIVSHPGNVFYKYHQLLGEQLGAPVVSLQDLQIDKEGQILFNGEKIDLLFRQCSMLPFLDPKIADPRIIEAVKSGKVILANGPIAPILGDKSLLPVLPELGAAIGPYLPEMKIVKSGEEINLQDYADWWLKGETRGASEMTLQLDRRYRNGWAGQVVKAVLKGSFQEAENLLSGKDNNTAAWFMRYVKDFQISKPGCFLLQKNIDSMPIVVSDGDINTESPRTMLRMYFVPDVNSANHPHIFLEMKAGQNSRLSANNTNIPVLGSSHSEYLM